MIFIKFIFSKAFFEANNFILNYYCFFNLFTLKWLKSYTNHGITIEVPDLVGLSLNETIKFFKKIN